MAGRQAIRLCTGSVRLIFNKVVKRAVIPLNDVASVFSVRGGFGGGANGNSRITRLPCYPLLRPRVSPLLFHQEIRHIA